MALSEKEFKPILLTWIDSETAMGWHRISDVVITEMKVHSLGYLIKEDDKAVVISTSISENHSCVDPLTIPKCAIIKRSDWDDE